MGIKWKAVAFKFVAPGSGTMAISTCGFTTHDTVWEVFSTPGGPLNQYTATHVMGKDEGCDVLGPTEGTVKSIQQGVTYYILVRGVACFACSLSIRKAATPAVTALAQWRVCGPCAMPLHDDAPA